jgi:xylulokinase
MKYLIGYDIGTSSIKAALLDIASGTAVAAVNAPETEMEIHSPRPGFAEQHPDRWWDELVNATHKLRAFTAFKPDEIAGIGISYQMHGLVCVDVEHKVLRPSIIWCDSRAVDIGKKAFHDMGEQFCLDHFLNSPGNLTASKLRWVKENEPELFARIRYFMLPGDFIAMRLTGEASTTISGLSEGILWDFPGRHPAQALLDHYGIPASMIPPLVPQFGDQGRVNDAAATLLGIAKGTPVSYRAGDQPNNAYSLNVLEPGEVAATAGTSGVVYGVSGSPDHDPLSRVNSFVHVNHTEAAPRYGVLLCLNGTGILNSWLRRNMFNNMSYADINTMATSAPVGSGGLRFYPFGNGAERVLENLDPGATLRRLDFNRHDRSHVARAAQEGIVFALQYGMEVMRDMGMDMRTVRAGHANMFLSPLFADTFASTTGCTVELYNTDGALGAARAAGAGCGAYPDFRSSFRGMNVVKTYEPARDREAYVDAYAQWKAELGKLNQQA